MRIPKSYRLPLAILFVAIIGWIFLIKTSTHDFYQPTPFSLRNLPIIGLLADKKEEEINNAIHSFVMGSAGEYAVYIKNLKDGKIYKYNENTIFNSASLYKLAILYKVYEDIEKGKLKPSEVLTSDKAELDKKLAGKMAETEETLGDEGNVEEQDKEEISYRVDFATKLMIRISDNYSALLLAQRVGWTNAEKSLGEKGISFDLTSKNAPQVNAFSTVQFLERIYRGEAVSAGASKEMTNILLEQQINDRIPKLLPEDIKVAHKTGEIDNFRHDAGIVYGKKADYLFVFLTKTNDPLTASDNIAVASKKIFDILED